MLDVFSSPWFFEDESVPKSVSGQIAEYIAQEIIEGHLEPGAKLREEDLSLQLKTSRAPIREALFLLQMAGFVERTPRKGATVRKYSKEEIQQVYEVRGALEHLALQRVYARWDSGIEQDFIRVLSLMEQALTDGDIDAYSNYNFAFHRLLFRGANSPFLWNLYRQLNNPLIALVKMSMVSIKDLNLSYHEHAGIVRSLSDRRMDLAQQLLNANLEHGMSRLYQGFDQRSDLRKPTTPP